MTQPSSDLTSRLEETNVRMKKLSDVFTTCEESFSDTETLQHATDKLDENQDEECVLDTDKNSDDIKSFHPLMRTTKIVGGKNPFEQVVENMIPEQQNDSSSRVLCSSVVRLFALLSVSYKKYFFTKKLYFEHDSI